MEGHDEIVERLGLRFCRDKNGSTIYESRESAARVAEEIPELNARAADEECPVCGNWHLAKIDAPKIINGDE